MNPTHAVIFRNNFDGEGYIEYHFVYIKDGVVIDYDTGSRLLRFRGDKILKSWKLKL